MDGSRVAVRDRESQRCDRRSPLGPTSVATLPTTLFRWGADREVSVGTGDRFRLRIVTVPSGDSWLALCPDELDPIALYNWAITPDAGAVVMFSGTARDHSPLPDGATLTGVSALQYEAYDTGVEAVFDNIEKAARDRFPAVRRFAVHHRTGVVEVGESAVVVVAASAHRSDAFEAARWLIDTVKAALPVWKMERTADGDHWSQLGTPVESLEPSKSLVDAGRTRGA